MNGIGCTLVLTGAAAFGAAPAPSQRIETIMQDDAALLYRSPSQVDRSLDRMARLGVDRVRLTASWRRLEPRPGVYDPDALHRLDRAVRGARARGMRVMVDLGLYAPAWAVTRPAANAQRNVWRPSVPAYGRFSRRMAERYRGRVRLWTTWNEPNNWVFLQPQSEHGRSVSPALYRRLHNAAYDQLKEVSHRNRVLIGGLASRGASTSGPRHGIPPLRFTRELACVDARLRPLRTPDCRGFRPLRADGFSMHPYTRGTALSANNPSVDRVQIGELGKLTALLHALKARGRLARALPVWLTEYGYDPGPRGGPAGTSSRFAGQALFLAWRSREVRSFPQFLLEDTRAVGDFQTGLLTPRGRPKPGAVRAFTMPFTATAVRSLDGRGAVIAFGQVRPGRTAHGVVLQRRTGAHRRWRQLACLATDGQGIYSAVLPGAGRGEYRAVWVASSGRRASAAVSVGQPAPIAGTPEQALRRAD